MKKHLRVLKTIEKFIKSGGRLLVFTYQKDFVYLSFEFNKFHVIIQLDLKEECDSWTTFESTVEYRTFYGKNIKKMIKNTLKYIKAL